MTILLFDQELQWQHMLPLTFTRPLAGIRIGIWTIAEKWSFYTNTTPAFFTLPHLRNKYGRPQSAEQAYWINGGLCPNPQLWEAIQALQPGQALVNGDVLLAANSPVTDALPEIGGLEPIVFEQPFTLLKRPQDIFLQNGTELKADFEHLTKGRSSAPLSASNTLIGPTHQLFIEEGAQVEGAILNTTTGPVYIGRDAEVMEGSVVRGPLALCEHAALKMATKVYGPTTIGPHSKVGGELNNVVIFGYSNKAHDGFLGNAVLGEWCNIGADSNNSNLKNNYAEVKLWDYSAGRFTGTGLLFCGLIMGDHAKCGINTMFNTGTVVGVGANVFGSGFPRNFVPDFAWGGAQGFETFRLEKMVETARMVMGRRQLELSETDLEILQYIYESTREQRYWEKQA